MTASAPAREWTAVPGWASAHLIRPYTVPRRTVCGRTVPVSRPVKTAPPALRPCRGCILHTPGATR